MSERLKPKREQKEIGGRLSPDEVNDLLRKYGEGRFFPPPDYHGVYLELDPDHSEFFKIGETRLQKLKTIGFDENDKPKPIETRIEELLGIKKKETWSKKKRLNPAAE